MYKVYYTYLKENPIKSYIGMTMDNQKNYLGSGVLIKRAIKKYSKDAFQQDVLLITNDIEEAHFF